MPRLSAELFAANYLGPLRAYQKLINRRIEAAALIATDRAAQVAKGMIRAEMQAAGLGRLGNAIDANSDMQRSGKVHRSGDGFSASGAVFIRTRSARTRGTIESYTVGSDIRPVRGRWLWIATDQIPRVTARERMTPELYRQNGFDQKIGPLVMVKSVNGYPLLIVRTAGVSASGRLRSARSLKKNGLPRKGQVAKEFIVAFIAIPRTARAARVDVTAIMRKVQSDLPRLYVEAIGRTV